MICTMRHMTRIFFVLAFVLHNVSGQKENKKPKEPKNPPNPPPSISNRPSFRPTAPAPSLVPTPEPSSNPTSIPSESPSNVASGSPTDTPSNAPTEAGSNTPTTPSENLSSNPTDTQKPTVATNDFLESNAPTTSPAPSVKPSDAASSTPSSQPPAMDSAEPTLSIAPSTSAPSQLPSIPGASARPTVTASMPPSISPSTSSSPSEIASSLPTSLPTERDTTGFQCVDDPAFTNLTADAFGNVTDCAWFEYYIFNSCRDFGGWNDGKGNTANASCCVCGGGLLVDPEASPSPSLAPSEPPTVPLRCGCRSCTEDIWNKKTGTSSFTCGDRILFLMSPSGGGLSEEGACYQIGHDEYPEDCKFCTPDHCLLDDPSDHFHCGCSTCRDEAWNTVAEGDTCGDRIMFLQNVLGMERRKACEQVGFLEYPNECGACDPNTCRAATRSSGVSLRGKGATWKPMFALPMLAYAWFVSQS